MAEPSVLFTLCTECRWDEAIRFVKNDPSEAQKLLDTGKRGAAPISALQIVLAHAKCRGDVPIELVEALLNAAPNMAAQRHLYTGNFPLHAVFYNAFFSASKRTEITELILRACPSAITLTNNDGRTPLHTNCSQHCNHEPIVALLEAAPETARWGDNNRDLPIHLACRSQKSPNKSIQALFEAYPPGIRIKNDQGFTPLELAKLCVMSDQKKKARIELVLKLRSISYDCNSLGVVSMTREESGERREDSGSATGFDAISRPSCSGFDSTRCVIPRKLHRKRKHEEQSLLQFGTGNSLSRKVTDFDEEQGRKAMELVGVTETLESRDDCFRGASPEFVADDIALARTLWMERNCPHILVAMRRGDRDR